MSAIRISFHDYICSLRTTVPYVHPAARATVAAWLAEANDAADRDDAATVARFALLVERKVAQELQWQREDAEAQVGQILGNPSKPTKRAGPNEANMIAYLRNRPIVPIEGCLSPQPTASTRSLRRPAQAQGQGGDQAHYTQVGRLFGSV